MQLVKTIVSKLLLALLLCALQVEAEPRKSLYNVSIDRINWQAYQDIDNGLPGVAARIRKSLGNDRRVLSEFYIMQRAIELSGDKDDLAFYPGTNSYRDYIEAIGAGEVLTNGDTQFVIQPKEILDNLYVTQPVLKAGQFHVGLYTSKDNFLALNAKIGDLKNLSAISNPDWKFDWQELSRIDLQRLDASKTWIDIFEAVRSLRSDFTLQAFSRRSDLSFHYDGRVFLPIPNLKFQFKQSRHYLISKKHPQGRAFYHRLEMGLNEMRKTGEIERIYQETGVFNLRVRDWTIINP